MISLTATGIKTPASIKKNSFLAKHTGVSWQSHVLDKKGKHEAPIVSMP